MKAHAVDSHLLIVAAGEWAFALIAAILANGRREDAFVPFMCLAVIMASSAFLCTVIAVAGG